MEGGFLKNFKFWSVKKKNFRFLQSDMIEQTFLCISTQPELFLHLALINANRTPESSKMAFFDVFGVFSWVFALGRSQTVQQSVYLESASKTASIDMSFRFI